MFAKVLHEYRDNLLGCNSYYHKSAKFRMSPYCYGCHLHLKAIVSEDNTWLLLFAEYPDMISKNNGTHLCWMPCLGYEIIYVEE